MIDPCVPTSFLEVEWAHTLAGPRPRDGRPLRLNTQQAGISYDGHNPSCLRATAEMGQLNSQHPSASKLRPKHVHKRPHLGATAGAPLPAALQVPGRRPTTLL